MLNLKKLFTNVKNCANNVNTEVIYSKKNVQFLNFLKSGGFIGSFKKVGKNRISINLKLDSFGNSSLSFFRTVSGNKKLRPLCGSNRNYIRGNFNTFFSNNQLNLLRLKKPLKEKDSNF
jgi:ribosomal protein S8